mgnify:CR=1 FL=1
MRSDPIPASTPPGRVRPLWAAAGIVALSLGVIGIFLPVLPTTPLVLLAGFCFGKGSPRLRAWIITHRSFGPMIADWEATGAIPRKVKYWACAVMALTFLTCLYLGLPSHILWIQGVLMGIGAIYVLSRPNR